MKITELRLSELTPYARNPRKNDAAVKGIASSIKEFGFKVPIVIDEKNVIVCGHTRLKAAEQLGLKTVPCIVADDLTPGQIKAYRILDNKLSERAEWDSELLTIELDELELDLAPFDVDFSDDIDPPEVDTSEDEVPEPPAEPQAKLGDVWRCGKHTVVCGDSTDAKNYEGCNADLCFTSPPYNVGESAKLTSNTSVKLSFYDGNNDNLPNYAELLNSFIATALAICDVVAVNIQMLANNKIDLCDVLSLNSKNLADVIIWDKGHAPPPMAARVLSSQFEFILLFTKSGKRSLPKTNFRGTIGNVYNGPPQRNNDYSAIHAATFPMHLPYWILNTVFTQAQTILDPFLGTGTTLIAAERLGRICYGIELEPKYVDVILQRYYNETGEIPVNQTTGKEFIPQS